MQSVYFESADMERAWLDYTGRFRAQSNFASRAARPFGDPEESEKSQDRFAVGAGNAALHKRWREARGRSSGYADAEHPFRHQGSADLNLYKLFLEATHALLRTGGRLGLLIPSGIYSDYGTGALRGLFLERCHWEWLFGFENREGVFPIDGRFKFNPIVVEKGGTTDAIRTAFMRRNLNDWERAEELATPYTRAQITQFSPKTRAILEIQSRRDLAILEKIYANGLLLGDERSNGWEIQYSTEFHMTNDSRLFPPRQQWEAEGYRPDEYSRWLLGDWRPISELWAKLGVDPSHPEPAEIEVEKWLFETAPAMNRREIEPRFVHGHLLKPGDVARTDWRSRCAPPPYDGLPVPRADIPPGVVLSRDGAGWIREVEVRESALPLHQGIMVQPFIPSARGWISGTGLRAKWDYGSLDNPQWNPQFLVKRTVAIRKGSGWSRARLGYREVARSTDARSFIGAVLPSFPSGHKVPILHVGDDAPDGVANAAALFNSLLFDWLVRQRLGAAALAWYVLAECALPRPTEMPRLLSLVDRLNFSARPFAAIQTARAAHAPAALCPGERIRLRSILDAVVCTLYGCDSNDLRYILRDCDLPTGDVSTRSRRAAAFDPRGFWRVDRDKDPELRHPVLALIALHDLEAKIQEARDDRDKGIDAFLNQNHGEGWLLPETLRLADYGLGHDDRARHPQPVASRLGPRFFDWQLTQTPEESHRESHLHARNLLGEHRYRHLLEDIQRRDARYEPTEADLPHAAEPTAQYGPATTKNPKPGKLF